MTFPATFEDLVRAMHGCEQAPGISVLKHGQMVNDRFLDLYYSICHNQPLKLEWRLPDWFWQHRQKICCQLLPLDSISRYQVYHDCGKPYCKVIDESGKSHYPDHAKISGEIWRSLGNPEAECRLMELDMEAHKIRREGYPEFWAREEAMTLWITAFCEIHANAEMFGGIESVSFKIKWKRLEKLGRFYFKEN
jgi:hypothetical protein